MIKFAKSEHSKHIAALWNEAFGDEISDVLKYLDVILKYYVVYEECGEIVGILSLLPVTLKNKKGRYVYAVATKKEARKKGISTKLLEFAKGYIKENDEEFLVLVPQNDTLFEFYRKRQFVPFSCVGEKKITRRNEKTDEVFLNTISASEYMELRKQFFKDRSFIEWNCEILEFAKTMYNGEFIKAEKNGRNMGIAFCFVYNNVLHIKELLSYENELATEALAKKYEVKNLTVNFPEFSSKNFAMIYPEPDDEVYFNIALD